MSSSAPSSPQVDSQSSKLSSTTTEDAPVPVETIDLKEPVIPIVPFAVALPSMLSPIGGKGIVGSIVIMGEKSAMVWISWGPLDTTTKASAEADTGRLFASFGKGAPTMGQLVVAMPRTNYKGAFATGSKEGPCSQLVGSSSSEDQMLANQMASRLSSRSGMAIYVSCQLSSMDANNGGSSAGINPDGGGNPDLEMLSHHAAALAEKEIWRILQKHQLRDQ